MHSSKDTEPYQDIFDSFRGQNISLIYSQTLFNDFITVYKQSLIPYDVHCASSNLFDTLSVNLFTSATIFFNHINPVLKFLI